jgi:capsular exopolysaccharide synthesis family protein
VAVARQRWVMAQAQEQGLAQAYAQQKAAALSLKAREVQYAKLKVDNERLRQQADGLDNRIKEVSIAQSAGALNIDVFEPALASDDPVKPAKSKMLAAALLAGLVIGAGLGVLREWVDPRVRTAEYVKGALGMAVVGVIPRIAGQHSSEARGWIVHLDSLSPVAEAYRSVRTAVTYGQESPPRTILITSPSAGEGKSTLASNLAIAMAKAGKRVLLVDCDFRSPVQHRVFGVRDDEGIAAVLASGEPIECAIHRTAVERLDVLPCGPVPRDPSEILNSESFAMTLDGLAAVYDHVLIDSPATSLYNDARIIGASCDATLLVIRAEKSNRRVVETSRDGLISVGAKIVGVVLNDVRGAGSSNSRVFGAPPIDYADQRGEARRAQKQLPAGQTLRPLMAQLVNECHLQEGVTALQRRRVSQSAAGVLYTLNGQPSTTT